MRRKMMKKCGKRIMAAALSLILAMGMFWGNCRLEASASGSVTSPYTVTTSLTLTLEGYEGEGTPEFGEVVLMLSKDHDDHSSYDIIRSDQMIQSGSGTVLTYEYTFEGGKYYNIHWGIDAGRGFTSLTNAMVGTVFLGDNKDETFNMKATAYRFCFMDGKDIYYEQYARSTFQLYNINNPNRNGHVFRGWSDGNASSKILSLSDIKNKVLARVITYYAVWDHPAEDTWDWNSDSDSHWKECSCGELKTAEEAHTWNDGVITRQPTPTQNGEIIYVCADCGKTRTEVLPATGTPAVSGNNSVSGNNPPKPDKPDVPNDNDTPANPNIPDNNDVPANPDIPGDNNTPANTDIPGNNRAPANNNTNTNISQSNGENPANISVNTANATGKNKEPKTGDTPYVEIYATVAMIAGMAYLLLYFNDDEHGMSEEEKQELMSRLIAWAKKGGYFRRIMALTAIFFLSCYYHSIGKKSYVQWQAVCGK